MYYKIISEGIVYKAIVVDGRTYLIERLGPVHQENVK